MLRIGRKADGDVVFTLSGRIDKEHIVELEALIAAEGKDRRIVFNLKELTSLRNPDGMCFFLLSAKCLALQLANCDLHSPL